MSDKRLKRDERFRVKHLPHSLKPILSVASCYFLVLMIKTASTWFFLKRNSLFKLLSCQETLRAKKVFSYLYMKVF